MLCIIKSIGDKIGMVGDADVRGKFGQFTDFCITTIRVLSPVHSLLFLYIILVMHKQKCWLLTSD